MLDRLTIARLVQTGFFVTGLALLATIYFGFGGMMGAMVALATTLPFSALVVFGIRCRKCGASYYFERSKGGWNLTGVNLLKPVSEHCRNCGEIR